MNEKTNKWLIFISSWVIVVGVIFIIYSVTHTDTVINKQKISVNEGVKNTTIQQPTSIRCNRDNTSCVVGYTNSSMKQRRIKP